jgi:hypothetical protein
MSPYTVIPEATWRRWLRQERPEMVEFMPRIIQRAIPDSRDGRQGREFKPSGAEPSARSVERGPRVPGPAARVQ